MPAKPKLLTKSKFSKAWECPRKLYYSTNKEYASNDLEDPFLKNLARGGFQVGALAQQYFPGGVHVTTLDPQEAIKQTNELLQKERIIIFEGAFQFGNLFVRADIIRKTNRHLELIEVKAKSFDSREEFPVWAERAFKAGRYEILAKYKDKIIDLAFQAHVLQNARPDLTIRSFLMMADKAKNATVAGMNQLFKIVKNEKGREGVVVKPSLGAGDLGEQVLSLQELTDEIKHIFNDVVFDHGPRFVDVVNKLARFAEENRAGDPFHSSACRRCEFRAVEEGKKSGFKECWKMMGMKDADIEARPFVFDLWNFRGADKLLADGIYYLDQMSDENIKLKGREDGESGLSSSERQVLQVDFVRGLRKDAYFFDGPGFREEISSLKFPLHFIDFETSMVAIPFYSGQRPYEQIAFQFSHHVLHADGRLEHRTSYLDERVGVFPNFDFVRALRAALSSDDGAVLRFADHENSVLNQIREQLLASGEGDRGELVAWIESLTDPPARLRGRWVPSRQFVDMRDWVLRFLYLPATGGSNSIKAVLPAILSVGGASLASRFSEWVRADGCGGFLDPYSLLPPLFSEVSSEELRRVEMFFSEDEELADGGAAMMAFARMQFSEMGSVERAGLAAALKRYCGLDTLAMVMVWEWMSSNTKGSQVLK